MSAKSEPKGCTQGTDYLYYDSAAAKAQAPLKLSPNKLDQQKGALFNTLAQLYAATPDKNPGLAWFFYNDENPDDKSGYKNPVNGIAFKPAEVISDRGHTKGVLALDLASDTAFWLIHSVPKFAYPTQFAYPVTGEKEAQTLLCVMLPDVATALNIATQMFNCQQPNVYAASPLPKALASNSAASGLVSLMNNKVDQPPTFIKSIIPVTSPGGQAFQAIAKDKAWGQNQNPPWDFYNDLVGQVLNENLDVETWEHYATPTAPDHNSTHEVFGMNSVNLAALNPPINMSWSDEVDHAKLAISAPTETVHWVCVGDINFTTSMRARGGGTLAFKCEPLWQELKNILSAAPEPGAGPSSPTTKPATNPAVTRPQKPTPTTVPTKKPAPAKSAVKNASNPPPAASTKPAAKKAPPASKAAPKKTAKKTPASKPVKATTKPPAKKKRPRRDQPPRRKSPLAKQLRRRTPPIKPR